MKIIFKATLLFLMVFLLVVFMISCSKNYDNTTFIGSGGATIKGKVRTSASTPEPIGGATVALNGVDAGTTATDGTYVVTGVAKGTYSITATLGSSTGSTIHLVDATGQVYEDVDITIQQNTSSTGKIVGRVVDATTGNGINNVVVKVEEMDVTTLTVSGTTAASDADIVAVFGAAPAGDGYFILQNIDIGNFRVSFNKQGYFSNMKRLTVSGTTTLDAGTTFLSYDLSGAGMIVGHVTNTAGVAIASADVTLDTGHVTTTNANGDYKVENLPERIYDPNVPEPGYTVTITNGVLTQTSNKISVFAGKTTIVDITLGVTIAAPNLILPPTGSSIATDQPMFNWTGVGNAETYKIIVYQDVAGDGVINLGTDSIVWQYETGSVNTSVIYNTDAKAQPLVAGTDYVWEIYAANFSSYSAPPSTTFRFSKLDPSTAGAAGTSISQPDDGSVVTLNKPVIAWASIAGASGYRVRVYRNSVDGEANPTYTAGTDQLVWDYNAGTQTSVVYNTDSRGEPLVNGGTYLIFVDTLVNNSVYVSSTAAAPYDFTKAAMEPPVLIAPQTGITIDPSIATAVDFVWHSVPGATRYVLKIFRTVDNGTLVWEDDVTNTENWVNVPFATFPPGVYVWKVGVGDISGGNPVLNFSTPSTFTLSERASWWYSVAPPGTMAEAAATTATFTVSLNGSAPPTSDVLVTVSPDTQCTVAPMSQNIAAAGPYTTGNFTCTAINDGVVEGTHTSTITVTLNSQDLRYNGKTMTVVLNVVD